MIGIELGQMGEALVTLGVVLGMFVLFVRETYPTEVTALGGVAVLLVLGVLPYDAALDVLSNPAPWTIAAMFVVMGAMVRTGALDAFTRHAQEQVVQRPRRAMAGILLVVV